MGRNFAVGHLSSLSRTVVVAERSGSRPWSAILATQVPRSGRSHYSAQFLRCFRIPSRLPVGHRTGKTQHKIQLKRGPTMNVIVQPAPAGQSVAVDANRLSKLLLSEIGRG